jgi:hypothetical protein
MRTPPRVTPIANESARITSWNNPERNTHSGFLRPVLGAAGGAIDIGAATGRKTLVAPAGCASRAGESDGIAAAPSPETTARTPVR